MENSAMQRCCITLGLILSFLAKEACSLRCYHCGFSQMIYQSWEDVHIDQQTYPIAKRNIMNYRIPNNTQMIESECSVQRCQGENSACLKWSFTSNHPINITYLCTGNPGKLQGCYKQKIPGKDFLNLMVCLCKEDLCNSGAYSSNSFILSMAGIVFVLHVFFKSFSL